jgi:protein-S-isoprenylcysteine O-methyltransferase Ste14
VVQRGWSTGRIADALIVVLVPGIIIWLWSVALILIRVPRKQLITGGPYSLVKHPLYSSVALLVLPWIGFLLNTWLGLLVGLVLYVAARMFAPEEERTLAKTFGAAWDAYSNTVKIPWL